MKTIRVGVIGIGHLGRFHSLNYAQIPEAELIGLYDVDSEKAAKVSQEANTLVFNDPDDLLGNVDAVSVTVPTDKHFDVVMRALGKGVHCLVEKPIAQSIGEADKMIQAAAGKSLILQVGQIERFNPAMASIRLLDIRPQFIEAHRLAPFNPRGTEVSVILDLMIHDIDAVLHLVKSPIKQIDASGVAVVSDTIDIANARLQFENGAVANLTASRISQKKMRKMRIFQKDTYVSIDFDAKISEIYALENSGLHADMVLGEIGVGDKKKRVIYHRPESDENGNALRDELSAFVKTIQGQKVPAVSGEQGRAALAVAHDILRRIES